MTFRTTQYIFECIEHFHYTRVSIIRYVKQTQRAYSFVTFIPVIDSVINI